MAQIPTPPASRPGSETPDPELKETPVSDASAELLHSLDSLLEKYLDLLDRHQKSHAELARRISSGFFSLAQANYTCPPGRRYGADYYDERMKATRRAALQPPSDLQTQDETTESEGSTEPDEPEAIFAIESVTNENSEAPSETQDRESPEPDNNSKEASDSNTEDAVSTEQNPKPPDSDTDAKGAPKPETVKKKPCSSDPIRWFGVLVSPHLRNAQKSFTEVIDGPVPQLASSAFKMRALESEINRVRSELGQT